MLTSTASTYIQGISWEMGGFVMFKRIMGLLVCLAVVITLGTGGLVPHAAAEGEPSTTEPVIHISLNKESVAVGEPITAT